MATAGRLCSHLAVWHRRPPEAQTAKMKKNKSPKWGVPFGTEGKLSPTDRMVASTLGEWYEAKHRGPSKEEIALVNSVTPASCPFCGSANFVKNGTRKDGVRKYACRGCGRSFNPLTGTVFDSRKIPMSEWVEYLMHLFEFHSVATSARDNRNAETTGGYWLSKVFAVLSGRQDGVMLDGRVWLDETYITVDKKEREKKGGKSLRGVSRNLIAIGVATDGRNMVAFAENGSKPSARRTLGIFEGHIKPGSVLVHDGDNSHSLLISELGLVSEVHPTSETKGLEDRSNPMDPVNDLHSKLKEFLRAHKGFRREGLQDWLNLFWFIWSDPENRYEKVVKFIEMAISEKKVIRYRDFFAKKPD